MARLFDGTDDRLDAANAYNVLSGFSFACWFRADAVSRNQYLFTTHPTGDASLSNIVWVTDLNRFQLTQLTSGTALTCITNTGVIAASTTYHVAVTWTGASLNYSTVALYINGAAQTPHAESTNGTGTAAAAGGSHSLGGRIYDNARNFDGWLAHAGFYNNVLTADEVAALYNNGIGCDPRQVRPDALVAYWPLLNADGDVDWWGQNNLTAASAPTYADGPPLLMPSGIISVIQPRRTVAAGIVPRIMHHRRLMGVA